MYTCFDKKVVVITGAANGIGKATSTKFAENGAQVIILDRDQKNGEVQVENLTKNGYSAEFFRTDISQHQEVEKTIAQIISKYGEIHYAFNNAGTTGAINKVENCELDDWLNVINTNLNGVWYCMKYQLKQMSQQNFGVIVNTSSISGLHGVRNQAAYSASKHGVIGLTKSAALEYAKTPIRINVICPGWTETNINQDKAEAVHDTDPLFLSNHVVGRSGNTNEIAEAVLWLSSPLSSFVNGHTMVVDGGRMAL